MSGVFQAVCEMSMMMRYSGGGFEPNCGGVPCPIDRADHRQCDWCLGAPCVPAYLRKLKDDGVTDWKEAVAAEVQKFFGISMKELTQIDLDNGFMDVDTDELREQTRDEMEYMLAISGGGRALIDYLIVLGHRALYARKRKLNSGEEPWEEDHG